jgi:hypothetical protein
LVEDLWIEVNNIVIAVIYKHPKANNAEFVEKLELTLEKVIRENKTSIICGDININLIDMKSAEVQLYTETLLKHNFIPTITLPTRITDHSLTLIDHINLFRPLSEINSSTASGNIFFDISDHLPNFILLEGKSTKSKKRPYISIYSERNMTKFQSSLQATNWSCVLENEEANTAYDKFVNTFSNIFNASFPLVLQSRKSYKDKKWITPGLKVSIKHKNRLYKKYLARPNQINEATYKHYKNKLLTSIELAKSNYYTAKLTSDKAQLHDVWKVYSELLGRNKSGYLPKIPKLVYKGQLNSSNKCIANAFNEYFSNIGSTLAKQHDSTTDYKIYLTKPQNPQTMFIAPVTPAEVKELVLSLSPHKASGIDEFNAKTVKHALPTILDPITYVFNLSLTQGCVPKQMKISKVIPIYKRNEAFLPGNYRPISLLSIFDKILERLMYKRLHAFLAKHNILYDYQFGFRSNHSTILAITEIVDNIREELDKSNHVLGLYLDLTKAFDCVNHKILLNKLSHYGIRGTAFDWFKSYLSDRTQKTFVNDTYSDALNINTGVPQGSVLGPILFLIYVNDIAESVQNGKVRLFADDTNLFFSNRSIDQLKTAANNSLTQLNNWFSANKLSLNIDKTCFTVFSNAKIKPSIELSLNGSYILCPCYKIPWDISG